MPARLSTELSIHVADLADDVSAESFVAVFRDTLEALNELTRTLDPVHTGEVTWRIASVSQNSPLKVTIYGESDNGIAADAVNSWMRGLKYLNSREARLVRPQHFSPKALEATKRVVSQFDKGGLATISYETPQHGWVATGPFVAANIDFIRAAGAPAVGSRYFEEYGTIEGTLDRPASVRVHEFLIYDSLTQESIRCRYGEELTDTVRAAWGHRASVSGVIRYDREKQKRLSMVVHAIRQLRDQDQLPQFDDLRGINISGELDPVDYVRQMCDDD